ncbi:MAG: hypothetical protein WA064_02590 [Candidatus Moraniibacteriota bacterium]
MKKHKNFVQVLLVMVVVAVVTGCTPSYVMQRPNSPVIEMINAEKKDVKVEVPVSPRQTEMFILPHQTLGLEPTPSICKGDISAFLVVFPKMLLGGEYFLGTLRWNAWVIHRDGSESFGQVLFVDMHPSGYYYGVAVLDGNVTEGQMVIQSTDINYIYSPFDRELAIDREKYLTDTAYCKEKIQEVNKTADGTDFNIASLTKVENFQAVIKSWNQIKYPEGYLISPFGFEEVALIRGQNPQYSYYQKLVGTGNFAIKIGLNPIGSAIVTAAGLAIDLIRAANAPSKGRDFSSEALKGREEAFRVKYLLSLGEKQIKKNNEYSLQLLKN